MAVRPIILYGDPRLEAANAEVEHFDPEVEALVDDLFATAWAAPGLGLAAPQIGVNLRVAVVDLSVGKRPDDRIVLVNPQVVEQSGKATLEEGCLSFPGLFTTIPRPTRIRVEHQGAGGQARTLEAEGLLAQAVCHEIDHLDARLLIHHLTGLKRRMFLKRVRKMRDTGVWPATA